jgi:DNA-binding GntR family transcriptional regulator
MAAVVTKAERLYLRLRGDILAGRHHPGQRLRYSELCERYGTSMGVLREGLLRLAEQGLVRGEPQQGFHVVELSPSDLRELTAARRELETLTLRYALNDGDVEWESRLLAAHHRLSRAPQFDADDGDRLSDPWVTAHAAFHTALLDGCANRRLKAITATLRDSAELYRRWSVPLGDERERDIAAEHAGILDAALARQTELATSRLAAHVQHTTDILLASPAAMAEPGAAEPSLRP